MRLFVQQRRMLWLLITVLFTAMPAAYAQVENGAVVEAAGAAGQDSAREAPATPVNYAMTVIVNPPEGGAVSRNPDQIHYAAGTDVNVMATPAEGYAFAGWSGDTTAASLITVTMDGPKTLTANFYKQSVTAAQVENGTDVEATGAAGQDSARKAPATPENYAMTVIVNPPEGGAVSRNPDQIYYAAGTDVNIMVTPAEGYAFAGWSGDTTAASLITVTMDGPKTLTANFRVENGAVVEAAGVAGQDSAREAPATPVNYAMTVIVNPPEGGAVSRNPDQIYYAAGTDVNVMATPAEGYAFAGWSGDTAVASLITVTMDGPKTLTADFYKQSVAVAPQTTPPPIQPSQPPQTQGTRVARKTEERGAAMSWGLGLHWGFDFSMNMKNGEDKMESVGGMFDMTQIPSFKIPDLSAIPAELAPDSIGFVSIPGQYIKITRTDWKRSALNFGGKIFIDVVPYVDIIELSLNIGVWEYDCAASYLDVDSINKRMFPADGDGDDGKWPKKLTEGDLSYIDIPLTLKGNDMSYFGLDGTPYAKLQLDASVRKMLFGSRYVNFNAGAGMSVHFATPLLNGWLIEAVQRDRRIGSPEGLVNAFMEDDGDSMVKDIVQKIIDELFVPKFGAHIAAGAHFRLSTVGVYVDGKFLIPLSKYDENKQVRTIGFLLNTGVSLSF